MKIEQFGSVLENSQMVKPGDRIYFLRNKIRQLEIMADCGIIERVNNIDNRGYGNTYCDINVKGKIWHICVSEIYKHKPRKVRVEDEYGFFTRWM